MKILIMAFFFLTFANGVKSQVIEYFGANQNTNDSLTDLRYFKNLDKSVREKLDSFLVFIKSKKKALLNFF